MGLMNGYENVRDSDSDSGLQAVGPAHAVENGEEHAICGRRMAFVSRISWPHLLGARCPECIKMSPG